MGGVRMHMLILIILFIAGLRGVCVFVTPEWNLEFTRRGNRTWHFKKAGTVSTTFTGVNSYVQCHPPDQ